LAPNSALENSIREFLSDPSKLPGEFTSWMVNHIQNNPPQIPITQIVGYQRESISARVTRTADSGTLPSGTRAPVTWQAARWNGGTMWDAGDPTKLQVRVPGKYFVWAEVSLDSGFCQLEIWKNNSTREAADGNNIGCGISTLLDLVVGDYVEVYVIAPNAGHVIHKENDTTPEFAMTRISQ
jgi:hypothetical protein